MITSSEVMLEITPDTQDKGDKMKQKYQLGEEVKVEFIGKITDAKLVNGAVWYAVDGGLIFARAVTDNYITPLETPKEIV